MQCKKCLEEKENDDFYASNANTCKECIKQRTKQNRQNKIEYYRLYDRERANLPHRVKARSDYYKTDNYKRSHFLANKKYLSKNPEIYSAHIMVDNAIRNGSLKRKPCLICGNIAEAHHFDYSLPLNVIWLCNEHHKNAHKIENEIKRQRKSLKS